MIEDAEQRALAIGKLFVGFGVEGSPEQLAVYIEATQRRTLAHLRRAVDHVLATRTDEQGFPKPGDLNAVGRRYLEAERSEIAAGERKQIAATGQRTGMIGLGAALRTLRLPASLPK